LRYLVNYRKRLRTRYRSFIKHHRGSVLEDVIAGKIVDAGQVIRGEKKGRTSDQQITYFENSATWGVGAAAIGGLIYKNLREQKRRDPRFRRF
jgi:ornithine cyclodeaminase/alanine dehydrogenase-like protein (mu-crystallin family)